MKKIYQKPVMKVKPLNVNTHLLGASNPKAYNEVSTNASYAKGRSMWDEEDDELDF